MKAPKSMKTIVIASQKGGSAKTTLTALLSVAVEQAGDGPAWIIDTDYQGTLARWHERRESEVPQRAHMPWRDLRAGLVTIADKHRGAYCFIDTAPTVQHDNAAIIDLADLVIIPVQPSPLDLWSAAETIQMVKDLNKPFMFVLTKSNARANITAQTVAALSNHGRVAASFIADRVGYAVAMARGNTAPELQPNGVAADEVSLLWSEIKATFTPIRKRAKEVLTHG
jgi:chromosome partitioning protein